MDVAHSGEAVEVGANAVPFSRRAQAVAAAWLLSLGIDFLLHGGILARLYFESSPFLLGPREAFRRIPIGYLSFLVLTVALEWLIRRLGVVGFAAGMRTGAAAGAVVWGALLMGLYSIATASTELLAGWWVGQTLELAAAGSLLGAAVGGASMRRLWVVSVAVVVACLVVTVVLQSLGWAPQVSV